MKVEREFRDAAGQRWRVAYTEAGIRGLITMTEVVFKSTVGGGAGSERFLTVFPGYLERADEAQLQVALSQAQALDPPR